jgi:uncharacterized membrane protein
MVTPVYALIFGSTAGEGFTLLLALSVAVMVWSPCFNTLFDWTDLRFSGRVASDRPHGLRLVHAVLHEASSVIVTLPLILWIGGLTISMALMLDLGLTLFYSAYAYVFHVIYDRLRPVRTPLQAQRLVTQSAGQELHDHVGQGPGQVQPRLDIQPGGDPVIDIGDPCGADVGRGGHPGGLHHLCGQVTTDQALQRRIERGNFNLCGIPMHWAGRGEAVAFDFDGRKAPGCQGDCAGNCLGRIAAGPQFDGQGIGGCQIRQAKQQSNDTNSAHLLARVP